MKHILIIIPFFLLLHACTQSHLVTDKDLNTQYAESARNVMIRLLGKELSSKFRFEIKEDTLSTDSYYTEVRDTSIFITGNTPVAVCRGAYEFLRKTGDANISWSGINMNISKELPSAFKDSCQTPYRYRYYFNVVTHGYTTPYWDWRRWEKEIDWMAVHGINMPLLGGAYEAIMYRVFERLGLTKSEIDSFFTSPAHLPWNRMGNITHVGGPTPTSFWEKQLVLNHQIISRMRELQMHPIIQSFAGFVPKSIQRIYPDTRLRELNWGGFTNEYNAHILEPGSPLFVTIGKMYIQEWEKEFGKNEFFLADAFNEMDVPLSENEDIALNELSNYGRSVFDAIHQGDSSATWVMQGWTFPFQKDKAGKLFWTPERLHALLSEVPDDKVVILDLANEYNLLFWNIPPSWKMYNGFFGKKWVYSFIPNMGGKTPWNGVLKTYANASIEALNYEEKRNLVGFGMAPEGIENNEIVYELIADMGWRSEPVNLQDWVKEYCHDRYGVYPADVKLAYEFFLSSCFNSFTDHPRFKYQFGPRHPTMSGVSVHKSDEFEKGVEAFLKCRGQFTQNKFYQYDVIEAVSQYLGLKVDEMLFAYENTAKTDEKLLNEAVSLLASIDSLLASHPNLSLEKWITEARSFGNSPEEKDYYEKDAKTLITIWAQGNNGEITDYAARVWSGLVKDYYIPRLVLFYPQWSISKEKHLYEWEKKWVETPWKKNSAPFKEPVERAFELFEKYKN